MSFNGWWAYKLWLKHIIFDSINVNSSNSVSGSLIITHLPLFLHFCIFLSHFDLVSVVLVVVARFAQPARVMGFINVLAFVCSLQITSTMVARVAHELSSEWSRVMLTDNDVVQGLEKIFNVIHVLVAEVKRQLAAFVIELAKKLELPRLDWVLVVAFLCLDSSLLAHSFRFIEATLFVRLIHAKVFA